MSRPPRGRTAQGPALLPLPRRGLAGRQARKGRTGAPGHQVNKGRPVSHTRSACSNPGLLFAGKIQPPSGHILLSSPHPCMSTGCWGSVDTQLGGLSGPLTASGHIVVDEPPSGQGLEPRGGLDGPWVLPQAGSWDSQTQAQRPCLTQASVSPSSVLLASGTGTEGRSSMYGSTCCPRGHLSIPHTPGTCVLPHQLQGGSL